MGQERLRSRRYVSQLRSEPLKASMGGAGAPYSTEPFFASYPLHNMRACPNYIWNNCLGATSSEFDNKAGHPVVIFMPEVSKTHMGGTMRLGLRPTVFSASSEEWSKVRGLYGGVGKIWERHRHRYEVNPDYIDRLNQGGLEFMGKDEKGERMQLLELRGASQLHVFVGHGHVWSPHVSPSDRPPLLRWTASPPRILQPAPQPVPSFPWFHCCRFWRSRFEGTGRSSEGVFQTATP